MMYHDTRERTGFVGEFMYKVYAWMAAGLAITGGTAYYLHKAPLFQSPVTMIALAIAQIALVIILSMFITRLNFVTAVGMYLLYSVLTGMTLSYIFAVYTQQSIFMAFGICAGMFGVMATYGYFTREDLSGMGRILMMMLIGVFIAMVVNIFLRSSTFEYLISLAGVALFTALTAYDVQKIKQMGMYLQGAGEMTSKIALLGALTLYLDVINLFLFLLRIFGRRND